MGEGEHTSQLSSGSFASYYSHSLANSADYSQGGLIKAHSSEDMYSSLPTVSSNIDQLQSPEKSPSHDNLTVSLEGSSAQKQLSYGNHLYTPSRKRPANKGSNKAHLQKTSKESPLTRSSSDGKRKYYPTGETVLHTQNLEINDMPPLPPKLDSQESLASSPESPASQQTLPPRPSNEPPMLTPFEVEASLDAPQVTSVVDSSFDDHSLGQGMRSDIINSSNLSEEFNFPSPPPIPSLEQDPVFSEDEKSTKLAEQLQNEEEKISMPSQPKDLSATIEPLTELTKNDKLAAELQNEEEKSGLLSQPKELSATIDENKPLLKLTNNEDVLGNLLESVGNCTLVKSAGTGNTTEINSNNHLPRTKEKVDNETANMATADLKDLNEKDLVIMQENMDNNHTADSKSFSKTRPTDQSRRNAYAADLFSEKLHEVTPANQDRIKHNRASLKKISTVLGTEFIIMSGIKLGKEVSRCGFSLPSQTQIIMTREDMLGSKLLTIFANPFSA